MDEWLDSISMEWWGKRLVWRFERVDKGERDVFLREMGIEVEDVVWLWLRVLGSRMRGMRLVGEEVRCREEERSRDVGGD